MSAGSLAGSAARQKESKIIVSGGQPLKGSITVSGAKNAVLPIIAAALLSDSPCRITDVPRLADVEVICQVLTRLGAKTLRREQFLEVDASGLAFAEASDEVVRKMRASILVMGPLLARLGRAKISLPGGCAIGTRPIDLHLKGFEAMGASIRKERGFVLAETKALRGARIYLDFPSVGATENLMMAAAAARGTTVLENAAEEPEIVDLANFINAMGGRIRGAGTKVIKIEGTRRLVGCEHQVIPDRIEAGSYLVAAAITGGELRLENVITDHLKPVIAKLAEVGCEIHEAENHMWIRNKKAPQAVDIKTLPYPGFPTDMQAQFMALLTRAQGASVITETVFENRFMHAEELRRMGADIRINGRSAVVEGPARLQGAAVKASDLRAGAALVITGLAAEGVTEIGNSHFIDRGYDDLVGKLRRAGAEISRRDD
ncbi:MAG: UDP-N-acetylglucosamine 1-carboxyvinyltransferase [Peptococcaceae bacterium]|nr:UDP-N-acetylglucosamine 1-carboxyvinyltransferase [Peptococcaceae bacterium]